ncbi:putative ribonuclease H-like domain-containing protein [Tanacetum coccineum]
MNQFCKMKGIKREFSVAGTPQQNGVAERRNRTLIEAARTMVLVIKPHNKTPYELIRGRTPLIDFMKPFGFPITILNTMDQLGKFDGNADEGFFIGYSVVSKAMRVFNKRTRIVEETLNIRFLENAPNVTGNGLDWLLDVDSLSKSMNYMPINAENQTNGIAGKRDNIVTGQAEKKIEPEQEYTFIPICTTNPLISQDPKVSEEDAKEKTTEMDESEASNKDGKDDQATRINAAEASNAFEEHLFEQFSPFKNAFTLPPVLNVTPMNDTGIFSNAYDDEDVGAEADLNNLETTMNVSHIPITRINKDHPKEQIIRDLNLAIQTRRITKIFDEHSMVCYINKKRRTNHKDYQNCLFACFLSQKEPKKVIQALEDLSWVEAMQEELMQFKLQKVWTLVDLPNGKRSIGTKWVFRNKKDERGIVVRSNQVYVCQPPSFEDPHFPDKVYKVEKALYCLHQAPRAWYETLSTYLIKNGFRRGTIDKTLFIKKDKGDILLVQVYVDDIIFGSTKKSLCDEFEGLMHKRFQMSSIGELTFFLGLQVQQKKDGIFISQDKYVADILKKFDFATVKTTSTPMEPNKALVKDEEADNVDVHLYRSMIGSLMYLTASRPDIMFVVCACARFQVTPKTSHLHAVKRIFRYLKGQPKLGLWYPRDSPFDLEAFSDSDYAGASLDRKSTTGGCQFLGKRLISWQCKKQTIVANSTTEAEYVAAAHCCGQVLWIQNQMLDYGFNFMNTMIYIDNESTICIVKNPVFHSKTKHIEIRHHFIRDSYEKKLIQVIKIHTDYNVADLLTKAFDVSRNVFGSKTGSCKINAARQNVGNQNGLIVVLGIDNQNPNGNGNVVAARAEGNANGNNDNQIRCYNCLGEDHLACNCTVKPGIQDAAYLQKQMQIALKEEAGIQLTQEEFDFMADADAYEEIERVMHNSLKILEPIPESHQVPQNDSNVISEVSSVEQSGGTVEQHPATPEETRALYDSLYNNLSTEVEKVNSANRKLRETNADLTTELARYIKQEKCFEISQEKYDKLERCYPKSVYQEQCLTKKINALHLVLVTKLRTLNEEISKFK